MRRAILATWWDRIQTWFCHTFHAHISRPFRGYYICWDCLRQHEVPWAKR